MAGKVVIVGASMAGLRVAEQLRALMPDVALTMVGEEAHLPYNRPPLSKDFLAGTGEDQVAPETLAFKIRASLADVRWMLGEAAVSADIARGTLALAGGATLDFDGLVIATGLRPRRLGYAHGSDRRFALRTVDDALRLRGAIGPTDRLAIIGAGFIGLELAATLSGKTAAVTVVEPAREPLERVLGAEIGAALRGVHERRGVVLRCGRQVVDLAPGEDGQTPLLVSLDDGTQFAADYVIESIGSQPNVEWLAGNGLDLSDGILCDRHMRCEGRPNVVAAGDVARFPNDFVDDTPRRFEHWCVPAQTGKRAAESLAAHLLGQALSEGRFDPLPSFWSDQYDLRIQGFGVPSLADRREIVSGSVADLAEAERGLAVACYRGPRLIGMVGIGLAPAENAALRQAVVAGTAE